MSRSSRTPSPKSLDQEQSLLARLARHAQERPEKQAYLFLNDGERAGDSLTYAELAYAAKQVAVSLQLLSEPRDRVLLLFPQSLDYITAYYGCLSAGCVAVPAYPPKTARNIPRIQGMVSDSRATVVMTTRKIRDNMQHMVANIPEFAHLHWLLIEEVLLQEAATVAQWQPPLITRDCVAFLQYTSGSTSAPKGVMVTHGNLLSNHKWIQTAARTHSESVIVSWLPLFHDLGLIGTMMHSMVLGARCILMAPMAFVQKPLRWLQAIHDYRATYTAAPNFAYDLCVDKITAEQKARLDLSCWEVGMNAAEPVHHHTLARFADAFQLCGVTTHTVVPWYGLAEGTLIVSAAAFRAPQVNQQQQVSSGVSGPDDRVCIIHPQSRRPCQDNEEGEIWVQGPSVAVGYWGREEATRESLQAIVDDDAYSGHWLRTGDLGHQHNGELFVSGRIKDIILIRGQNHYPQDIERTVEQFHPALRPAGGAAFSVINAHEERLVVVQELERKHLKHTDFPQLVRLIRREVAAQHDLQAVAVVLIKPMTIPKTSSGKIQRHACLQAFTEQTLVEVYRWQEADVATALPTADLLQSVVWRLAELLRITPDDINPEQPLQELGLDPCRS